MKIAPAKKMDKASLSGRIKARREFLKSINEQWTQAYVAERLGYSREAWVAQENGRNEILATELPRIAEVLDTSVAYFLGEEDESGQHEIEYEPIMDELRGASYGNGLEADDVDEIAEYIRMKARRRAERQGRA